MKETTGILPYFRGRREGRRNPPVKSIHSLAGIEIFSNAQVFFPGSNRSEGFLKQIGGFHILRERVGWSDEKKHRKEEKESQPEMKAVFSHGPFQEINEQGWAVFVVLLLQPIAPPFGLHGGKEIRHYPLGTRKKKRSHGILSHQTLFYTPLKINGQGLVWANHSTTQRDLRFRSDLFVCFHGSRTRLTMIPAAVGCGVADKSLSSLFLKGTARNQ